MQKNLFEKIDDNTWCIQPHGNMHVPGIIYASSQLIEDMDDKVHEQLCNVASLPGICEAAFAMPDAHWGYGFPIGGVAAFDAHKNGVICAGGVGFDISCGVRLLRTGLSKDEIERHKTKLADALYQHIPAGVGSHSRLQLTDHQMDAMLKQGAKWAVKQGFGLKEDLEYIEENGCMQGATPETVSKKAKTRQKPEMGTLGSGNHYLEIQEISEIFDEKAANAFGLTLGEIVISIHCGSRGLGHQIG
ncbi:MAG TPA: RtcB family protein, partial [Gammaproteobacteria bacterium]|nr:RtcB family protein [Gammaproteobacteria bacterium]